MSLNGTVPPPTVNPFACATELANGRQARKAPVSDGLIPDGRKKLSNGAATKGPNGPTPQLATCRGNAVAGTAPAATAFSQFATSACEFTVFALIGRFR